LPILQPTPVWLISWISLELGKPLEFS
jgi:hypothetical protein